MLVYLLLILIGIALDQIVKFWIVSNFALLEYQPFIPGVVELFYIQNKGAAWGILAGEMFIFYGVTIIAILSISYMMFKERHQSKVNTLAYSLILAGAIGNFIDRIRLGYVVDMFHFVFMDFPVFNVADMYLTFGVVILILTTFISSKREEKYGK